MQMAKANDADVLQSGKAGFGKLGLISQAKKQRFATFLVFEFEHHPAALSAEYQETGSLSAKEALTE